MTTTPAPVNFSFVAGATFTGNVTLLDENDAPIDLTTYTGLMHIRREPTDDAPLLVLSTANTRITLGGALGTIALNIDADDTADITVDADGETWWYDLLMTNTTPTPDLVEQRLRGYIFATQPITRA